MVELPRHIKHNCLPEGHPLSCKFRASELDAVY
jgi:hypothetical protein